MSTAMSNVRGSDSAVNQSGIPRSVQASDAISHPQVFAAEAYEMRPLTRKIVYLFLLAGVLFLASLAAYSWYGLHQL